MPKLPKLKTVMMLPIWAAFILVVQSSGLGKAQSEPPADEFTEAAASKLLSQLSEGLRAHNSRKMLAVFDFSRMKDAPIFKEQVTAFFKQYDSIRVHFKLMEVKGNTVTVDAEMDATPPEGTSPPQHKSAQLRFTAIKTPAGWRLTDVQPRNFFS